MNGKRSVSLSAFFRDNTDSTSPLNALNRPALVAVLIALLLLLSDDSLVFGNESVSAKLRTCGPTSPAKQPPGLIVFGDSVDLRAVVYWCGRDPTRRLCLSGYTKYFHAERPYDNCADFHEAVRTLREPWVDMYSFVTCLPEYDSAGTSIAFVFNIYGALNLRPRDPGRIPVSAPPEMSLYDIFEHPFALLPRLLRQGSG